MPPSALLCAGDGVPPQSHAAARLGPDRLRCYQPPCEPRFGTHHSKAIFIIRPHRLTVHVCTGNFLFPEWLNKTNAVWSGSFPRRNTAGTAGFTGCAGAGSSGFTGPTACSGSAGSCSAGSSAGPAACTGCAGSGSAGSTSLSSGLCSVGRAACAGCAAHASGSAACLAVGKGAAGVAVAASASVSSAGAGAADFGTDLAQYYAAIKALGEKPPGSEKQAGTFWVPNDPEQQRSWGELSLEWIGEYDYSSAGARLIASVPGRHLGAKMRQWGHLKLREVLAAEARPPPNLPPSAHPTSQHTPQPTAAHDQALDNRQGAGLGGRPGGEGDMLVLQFSSLSSVGTNTAWLQEGIDSMSARNRAESSSGGGRGAYRGGASCASGSFGHASGHAGLGSGGGGRGVTAPPLRVRVVFPTRQQVRDSLEGWLAGKSIPCEAKNAIKLQQALAQLSEAVTTAGARTGSGAVGCAHPFAGSIGSAGCSVGASAQSSSAPAAVSAAPYACLLLVGVRPVVWRRRGLRPHAR